MEVVGGEKISVVLPTGCPCRGGLFSRYLLDHLSPYFSARWGMWLQTTGLMHQLMLVASAFVNELAI